MKRNIPSTYYVNFLEYTNNGNPLKDITVSGIPSDFKLDKNLDDYSASISGSFKSLYKNKEVIFTATTATGQKVKKHIFFTIIDEKSNEGCWLTVNKVEVPIGTTFSKPFLRTSSYVYSIYGSLSYEIVGDNKGLRLSDNHICGAVANTTPKTVKMKITSSLLPNFNQTFNVTFCGYYPTLVRGQLTSSKNVPIANRKICFYDVSSRNKDSEVYTYTDVNGYYLYYLRPNTMYVVRMEYYNSVVGVVKTGNSSSEQVNNFNLNKCKVNFSTVTGYSYSSDWKTSSNTYGNGSSILVPLDNKEYTLYGLVNNSNNSYIRALASATFRANEAVVGVTPTVTNGKDSAGMIYTGTTAFKLRNSASYWFKFVPTVTGSYTITSDCDLDTIGTILSSDAQTIKKDDDSGLINNFQITISLTQGVTYYIAAGMIYQSYPIQDSIEEDISIIISKNE